MIDSRVKLGSQLKGGEGGGKVIHFSAEGDPQGEGEEVGRESVNRMIEGGAEGEVGEGGGERVNWGHESKRQR